MTLDRRAYFEKHGHPPEAAHRIAIDFDGTIYPKVGIYQFPDPLPYAVEGIQRLKRRGFHITIWTSRLDPEWLDIAKYTESDMRDYIEGLLNRDGIPFDRLLPKPSAAVYVDDIAIRFNNNWPEIVDWVLFNDDD